MSTDGREALIAGHDDFLARVEEAAALTARRRAAREAFERHGLPTRRLESWRYTGIGDLGRRTFRRPDAAGVSAVGPEALERYTYLESCAARLVFVDGAFCAGLSRLDALPEGLRVRTLAAAIAAGEDGAAWFGAHEHLFGRDPAPMRMLNQAWFTDGALVEVDSRRAIERPLHLLFLTGAGAGGAAIYPRVVLKLGAGARLGVVQSHAGVTGDSDAFVAAVTTIDLGPGAELELDRIQREASATVHVGAVIVRQARGSKLAATTIDVGGAIGRVEMDVEQAEDGCETRLSGLAIGRDRQHVDAQVRVLHGADHGTSRQLFRGIFDDRSIGVFNGAIVVPKDVIDNAAHQTNGNLLASPHATVNTKPQLEIDAEDVRCSHGATVGAVDPEQIFYMRSRGIDAARARSMLTAAFASDVIDTISVEPIRERVHTFLAEAMRWTRTDDGAARHDAEEDTR